jgi:hypothetical protein
LGHRRDTSEEINVNVLARSTSKRTGASASKEIKCFQKSLNS